MNRVARMSVYDLGYIYMCLNRPQWIQNKDYKGKRIELLRILNKKLDEGFCSEDLIKFMWVNYRKDTATKFSLLKKPGERKRNLLKSDTLYLHNYLCLVPDFPVIDIDMESGKVTESPSCFYREQIASINMDQVCGFYLMHDNLAAGLLDPSSLRPMLKYVANRINDVDLLLFCIDIAEDMLAADTRLRITRPFDLINYTGQAKEYMSHKKMLYAENHAGSPNKRDVIKKRDKGYPWMDMIREIVG